jgi:hypothetical protein
MRHLVKSFQAHIGERGAHFYDDDQCHFLTWSQVFEFIRALSEKKGEEDLFSERLAETLANYDPDTEFLAVQQNKKSISVELYSQQDHVKQSGG